MLLSRDIDGLLFAVEDRLTFTMELVERSDINGVEFCDDVAVGVVLILSGRHSSKEACLSLVASENVFFISSLEVSVEATDCVLASELLLFGMHSSNDASLAFTNGDVVIVLSMVFGLGATACKEFLNIGSGAFVLDFGFFISGSGTDIITQKLCCIRKTPN
jgi:hypothetical protein